MPPTVPGHPTTYLIDLCHYFANADLQTAATAGVSGVILKATQGDHWRDPAFASLLARARAASLITAAYHFGTAAPVDAQLDHFIGAVAESAGGFEAVAAILDIESNTPDPAGTMLPDQAEQWAAGFRDRTGRTPMIYAGAYLRERGGALHRPSLAACPLWLAQYGRHPQALPGWPDWTLWQFTDGQLGPYAGAIPGVGHCDQSAFRGTAADLQALWARLAQTQESASS